jgi:hypothetical protein
MSQLHRYGSRQPYRLTVEPGATKTCTLNSDYANAFSALFDNRSTVGTPATVSIRLVDGGIVHQLGSVAPGEIAPVEFACPVRSITVSQPAEANGDLVLEVLQ